MHDAGVGDAFLNLLQWKFELTVKAKLKWSYLFGQFCSVSKVYRV